MFKRTPMIFSYDHMFTAFNNRLQVWKPLKWYTWKDFFNVAHMKDSTIKRDVYDHWKRFIIRISIINICFVYGYSEIQHIWNGRVVTMAYGDDDD